MSQSTMQSNGCSVDFCFTVDSFHRLFDAGIISRRSHIQLIRGQLKTKDPVAPYQLSVEKYFQMVDAGILSKKSRVQLLRGRVIKKMTINPPHASSMSRLTRVLPHRVPMDWTVRPESPVILAAINSVPEPDYAIVRGEEAIYSLRHPVPADFGIIIEVSDSSLLEDRVELQSMYAECMIPEYWIVNVVDMQIEVYTLPSGPTAMPVYGNRKDYPRGSFLPLVLEGKTVTMLKVDDLLP